ncbi:LuxR C-terminal-related transcriptional regulator [Robertmurraya sp. DFI.2.37]|uniref:LuxR C-terminal-related transcriptional regulator n=1 Tax=Robertmurraya sp. DFI.2.37 TaxID=3031819 RepID=UPI001CD9E0DB|nr:LuxR C-terminal-related transcriptional regulator [Robertmurraya sp. DFI.2.37]MDF1510572.1 LuxR C-terminal-related transcriptional regulator [Robertmurraya sp. DFI.2.37]
MGVEKTLQNLQDGYAHLLDLMVVLVDEKRLLKTKISYPKKNCEELLVQQMIASIPNLTKIKSTIYIEVLPGLKVLAAPIITNRQERLYLIGGMLVEDEIFDALKKYLQEHEEGAVFLHNLQSVKVVSNGEKARILATFQQLSSSIQSLYQNQVYVDAFHNKILNAKWAVENITDERFNLDILIQQFKNLNPDLSFVGIAVHKEEERYLIQHFAGQNMDKVLGIEVALGEGFLGQVIVTEEYSYWTHIQEDPRLVTYRKYGLSPRSLFCQPIKVGNQTKGLLFGGSEKEEGLFDPVDISILTSFIGVFMVQQSLKESSNHHFLQLSTFNEIFSVMTKVNNVKRVLYILIDMGMNILSGSFACVLFKEIQVQNKLSLLSRGMKNEQLGEYGRDLGKRHFSNKLVERTKGMFHELASGELVYEMPITFRSELFGVLSIGVRSKDEVKPYIPFLSSLGIAGGISIYLLQKELAQHSDEKLVNLLTRLLEKNEREKYRQSVEARKLVAEFAKEIGLNAQQINALENACTLIFYEQEILQDAISDKETMELMQHYYQAQEWKKVEKHLVKLLFIIFERVGEKLAQPLQQQLQNDPLYKTFEEWEARNYMTEIEIPFGQENDMELGVGQEEIKLKLNLSNREMEVLHQVLKGLNNREIAQSLFISDHTVKNHMTNILQKLGVTDRSQAIAKVYQMGYTPQNS